MLNVDRERSEGLKDIYIGALLTATVKELTEMGAILGRGTFFFCYNFV